MWERVIVKGPELRFAMPPPEAGEPFTTLPEIVL
jgi:hypothetical protein